MPNESAPAQPNEPAPDEDEVPEVVAHDFGDELPCSPNGCYTVRVEE